MSISEIFIRRPVMTTLVMFGILLFGIVGFMTLPVSDLPSVDYPTISVSANLPGASPEVMASAVATPLEKQFSTIAGVDSMTSSSSQGSAQITIQFSLDRSIDAAAADVQAAIAKAARQLPPNLPAPPTYSKVNPADSPVIYIAMSSSTLPLSVVDDYAENILSEQISQINGVAQVSVFGSQPYAVRVQVDPNKLAAFGLGIDQVEQAVEAGNVNQPLGTLFGHHQAFTVQASGQLEKATDFRPMIVAYRNGHPVRLQELGNVLDSVQNDKAAAWYNNTSAVILAVQRQPGANTVAVVDSVRRLLPQFRERIPASVNLDVLFDREFAAELFNDWLKPAGKTVIAVLNKCDLVTSARQLEAEEIVRNTWNPAALLSVSALKGNNLPQLIEAIRPFLPLHYPLYPEDTLSTAPERFFVSEIIREKIFLLYGREVPYSTEVVIDEFKEQYEADPSRKDLIRCSVIVERETQKQILIGSKGAALKKLGQTARKDIEEMLGRPVFLELFIKVRPDWRKKNNLLKSYGY